jgi:hypothetical protein
MLQTIEFP